MPWFLLPPLKAGEEDESERRCCWFYSEGTIKRSKQYVYTKFVCTDWAARGYFPFFPPRLRLTCASSARMKWFFCWLDSPDALWALRTLSSLWCAWWWSQSNKVPASQKSINLCTEKTFSTVYKASSDEWRLQLRVTRLTGFLNRFLHHSNIFPLTFLPWKISAYIVTSQIPPNKGAHFTLFNVQLNALIFYKSVTCDWKRCLSPQQICWFLFVFGREKLKWSETCKTLTRNSTYGA